MRLFWWTLLIGAVVMVVLVADLVAYVEAAHPPIFVNPSVPLEEDGVAMVMLCGEHPERETVNRTARAVLSPEAEGQYGWWSERRRSDCVFLLHHSVEGED